MASAAPFVVPALKRHTASVIMLHGLGDTGAGWMMLAQNWRRRNQFSEVSFIFPNAPQIPITINFGMMMPGWFDIRKLGGNISVDEFHENEDEAGVLRSRDYLNSLIAEEVSKGISPSRIVIGGFSQGGAISLLTGITYKEKLGAIFGLSTFLPLSRRIADLKPEGWPNKTTPIFTAHGTADTVVPFEIGTLTADTMKRMGLDVEYRKYKNMGHSADPLEVTALERFLDRTIPPEAGSNV